MNSKSSRLSALVVSISLLHTGYAGPGQADSWEGSKPGSLRSDDEMLLAANIEFARLVQTQTTLIRHTATPRQREVAQTRAVTYFHRLPPEKKVALKKRKVRYLAVDTEKNKETTPQAKKVIMIWDTHSESLVGKSVYDLPNPPAIGKTDVFDTYSAEYVGAGL